jgi:hypothetical protein
LQAEYGHDLTLWAVAVEDPKNLAGPFLRKERIEALHRSLDMDSYRHAFTRTELPALYLSFRDTIRGLWRPRRDGSGGMAGPNPTVQELVAELMTRVGDRD